MAMSDAHRLLTGLKEHLTDRKLALQLCRELGSEMGHHQWDALRELRSLAGAVRTRAQKAGEPEFAFVEGLLAAIGELLSSYEASVRHEEERQLREKLAQRHKDLLAALETPTRPSDLSKQLDKDPSLVSRILGELAEADLVEDVTSVMQTSRRDHWYTSTTNGKALLDRLRNTAAQGVVEVAPAEAPPPIRAGVGSNSKAAASGSHVSRR